MYLAIQIDHSREQTLQNTKAIEAQVVWANFEATRDVYLSRVPESNLEELLCYIRTWGQADIAEAQKQDGGLSGQALILIGIEFRYWNASYSTQSGSEDRQLLQNKIRANGRWPIHRAYLDAV